MNLTEIFQKVETIAQKYNPENFSPFPFEKLQDHEHIEIYLVDLEQAISGAIERNKDTSKFTIFIVENEPQTRQYFTIAAEVGHYFLYMNS